VKNLFLFHSVLTCMMGDTVRSKPWLGLLGNVSAVMATSAAFGLAMYLGVEFIGINLAAPFLMIGKSWLPFQIEWFFTVHFLGSEKMYHVMFLWLFFLAVKLIAIAYFTAFWKRKECKLWQVILNKLLSNFCYNFWGTLYDLIDYLVAAEKCIYF